MNNLKMKRHAHKVHVRVHVKEVSLHCGTTAGRRVSHESETT